MSKWVDVPVTVMKTYAVEIEDDETVDDAIDYAIEDCMGSGEAEVDHRHVTVATSVHQADQIKRLADEVLAL